MKKRLRGDRPATFEGSNPRNAFGWSSCGYRKCVRVRAC